MIDQKRVNVDFKFILLKSGGSKQAPKVVCNCIHSSGGLIKNIKKYRNGRSNAAAARIDVLSVSKERADNLEFS